MYSIHNEGKYVVAERFIRTLKTKIYKYMTSVSKNVYIDKLDDIVDDCNHACHRTIKIKPVDVKNNAYIEFKKDVIDKDSKFKVGDRVRISRYKNIFAKGYTPNWFEEHLEHFIKKNYKRLIKRSLEQKKLLGEKEINYMLNGKVMIIHLIAGLIRKIQCDSIDYKSIV